MKAARPTFRFLVRHPAHFLALGFGAGAETRRPLGIAIVGADFRFLAANPALCRMLGYGEEELLGRTFADITFASLGALAVLPPEYPGNRLGGRRLAMADIRDTAWRAEVNELRARPSGQFILRLYREERTPRAG